MTNSNGSDMRHGLTRDNLHGIWAAIATPFDANERFDEGVFRENIRRLAAAGVHGIYTTDSDGEFYAIELDEFKQIVGVFADETQKLGIPTQVGVTWCNTQGMLDRLQFATAKGILGAHIGHPFFMPMTPESYRAFWNDIQASVPESFGLIHYNSPRMHNYQRGPEYAVLQAEIPNLIGTKHVGSDVTEFMTLMAESPQLSHFTGEHAMTPYMLLGARGIYSWFVNFNPRFLLDWYAAIEAGRWSEARVRQEKLHAFIGTMRPLLGSGNLHGIVGKALTAASPFLVGNRFTRRPYLPVDQASIDVFRRTVEERFPDMLWKP